MASRPTARPVGALGLAITTPPFPPRKQGHLPVVQAVQLGEHRVEAVGHVGKEDLPPRVKKGLEAQGQHLVGAVAHKHVFRPQAVGLRQGLPQNAALRVGVEPQSAVRRRPDGRQGRRRGRIGVLVGVELDKGLALGLLPRHVGGQAPGPRTPKFLHSVPSSRRIFRMLFSALLRGSMTSWPQPSQRRRKSMPTRSTSHRRLPQGCSFFSSSTSPT